MNLQEMLRDKRFLIAAGVVGLVGVVVLVRKKGTASGDPATENGATGGGQRAFDTSGTDMAAWFSQYGMSVVDALREIAAKQQAGGSTSPTPNPNNPNVPRIPSEPAPPPPPWRRVSTRVSTRIPWAEPVPTSTRPSVARM